jgi:hypothetical protein
LHNTVRVLPKLNNNFLILYSTYSIAQVSLVTPTRKERRTCVKINRRIYPLWPG